MVHHHALIGQNGRDLGRRDRTVELVAVAHADLDHHLGRFDPSGQIRGLGPDGVVLGLKLAALLFENLQVAGSGQGSQALRQQIVSAVTGTDGDNVAQAAQVIHICS